MEIRHKRAVRTALTILAGCVVTVLLLFGVVRFDYVTNENERALVGAIFILAGLLAIACLLTLVTTAVMIWVERLAAGIEERIHQMREREKDGTP